MANRFFSRSVGQMSEKDALLGKYNNARYNLLLVVIATLVNVIFALVSADTYFLFSATVPYLLTFLSMFLCGMYPPDFYEGDLALFDPWPVGLVYVAVAISVVIIALYALSFFLSKNGKVGWLIFALVFFSLDTFALIGYFGIDITMVLDYVFHAWIIVILAGGIRAHNKLKAIPVEEPTETAEQEYAAEDGMPENSTPLRYADMNVKARVLLSAEVNGKSIVYRRVKKTNELVINGQVYDEYVAFVEREHTLGAVIDGHVYEAGMMSGVSKSFIAVDGEVIASKIKWI